MIGCSYLGCAVDNTAAALSSGGPSMTIVFYDHYDPATGEELWLNSGNMTELVKDINPGPGWSNPQYLTAIGRTLFFTAYDDTNGYQLWKTDGTTSGTERLTNDLSPLA